MEKSLFESLERREPSFKNLLSLRQRSSETPKVVPNLIFKPGCNLFEAYVITKNFPAIIFNVGESLNGIVEVLHAEVNSIPGTELHSLALLLASRSQSVTKDNVESMLSSSPSAVSVRVHEGVDGVLVDTLQFPIRLTSGNRAFFVAEEVFNGMLSRVRKVFGSIGETIVYEEGYEYGKKDAEVLVALFGREKLNEMIKELVSLYSSIGLGRPRLLEFDPGKHAVLLLYDNLECHNQKSDKPFSRFVKGHVMGMSEALFGTGITCEETKCMATGDDHCRFEISSQKSSGGGARVIYLP